MSSDLIWEPVKEKEHNFLPTELKMRLQLGGFGDPVSHTFTEEDIPFLTGLMVCDVKGASELIGLIQKHEKVLVTEVWL